MRGGAGGGSQDLTGFFFFYLEQSFYKPELGQMITAGSQPLPVRAEPLSGSWGRGDFLFLPATARDGISVSLS